VRACEDPERLPGLIESLGKATVQSHPSILSVTILDRAGDVVEERGLTHTSIRSWRQQWEDDEVIRRLTSDERSEAKWVVDESKRWWIEPEEDNIRVMPESELRGIAKEVSFEARRISIRPTELTIRWSGYPLIGESIGGQVIAAKSNGPLSIASSLVDPAALYRQERWQTFWLAALLGVALLSVLGGFYAMQRALISERQLSEQKSDFVASVSHELRTPVASMRLMLENLASGAVKADSSRQEYLQLLGGECRRLSNLIENVLDFARIENGRKEYQMDETDVAALIHDAMQLLLPRATQRSQTLAVTSHRLIQRPALTPSPFNRQSLTWSTMRSNSHPRRLRSRCTLRPGIR
jgi:signal transduction histidine kinase